MAGVFTGFATISVLIALGALFAQLRILDERGQRTLSTLAFYVASPALLITVMDDSDLGFVLSGDLAGRAAAHLRADQSPLRQHPVRRTLAIYRDTTPTVDAAFTREMT